ncbi:hypothetical protein ACFP2T_16340 [Plantactinospora solaniradicis]|uniref:Uncharacterized protein n=1 Tax=Plantactinospora solaniradicis TaxID=1723736 RepID=A0ABW1K859_9ACTN
MTRDCRPDPTRPRPDIERAREECTHPAEYRQPGGLCGCCGWDGFGVAGTKTNGIEMEGVA